MKKLIIILCILNFTNYFKISYNEDMHNQIIINRINLNEEIYSYEESTVDKNIIHLKESNIKKDLYILAAHSGNSKISYFKNLDKLKIGDKIIVIFDNKKIGFIVDKIYYVKKTGKIILPVDSKDTLYLTTCDKYDKNRQLIVKSVKKV